MTGVVMKILSEFCYIKHVGGIVVCKTKGIFRHKNMKVITGDVVEFDEPQDQEAYGMITDIYDRKSELYRPQIANIDQVVVISSVKDPNFDSYILNKYLTFISYLGIKKIIAFTKVDLIKRDDVIFDYIDDYQKIGIEIFRINNIQPASEEWEPFNQILVNKTSVFTGQTGAEAMSDQQLNEFMTLCHEKGVMASLALNPGTDVAVLEKWLPKLSNVLVMSVEPGFGGQAFQEIAVDKIKTLNALRLKQNLNLQIEIDGGINDKTIHKLNHTGIDMVVAGSYLFGHADLVERIEVINHVE
jgi:ribosome biogenesis GTPase